MPVIRVGGEGVYVAERKFEGGRYPPVVLVHGRVDPISTGLPSCVAARRAGDRTRPCRGTAGNSGAGCDTAPMRRP